MSYKYKYNTCDSHLIFPLRISKTVKNLRYTYLQIKQKLLQSQIKWQPTHNTQ